MPDPRSLEPIGHAARPETAEDIRLEMDATRARLTDTVEELDRRIHEPVEAVRERVAAVRERFDVGAFVRERPLTAALLAIGAGLALAGTGADRAVASGVARGTAAGARRAGRAAVDGARHGRDAARERLEEWRERREAEANDPDAPPRGLGRLTHRLEEHVERQIAVTLFAMRESASRLAASVLAEKAKRMAEDEARRAAQT